jgi:5-methylcytosine-specific restriction endonuclease McrA
MNNLFTTYPKRFRGYHILNIREDVDTVVQSMKKSVLEDSIKNNNSKITYKSFFPLSNGEMVYISNSLKVFCCFDFKCAICGDEPNLVFELKHRKTNAYTVMFLKKSFTKEKTHFKLTPFNSDHILPESKGGLASLANRQILCVDCNNKKGDMIFGNIVKRYKIGDIMLQFKEKYENNQVFSEFSKFYIENFNKNIFDPKRGYLSYDELIGYVENIRQKFQIEVDINELRVYDFCEVQNPNKEKLFLENKNNILYIDFHYEENKKSLATVTFANDEVLEVFSKKDLKRLQNQLKQQLKAK